LQGREVISGEFGAPKWDGCIVVGQLLAILVFNCIFKVKVKVVGSPPTLAQRVLNETLWNPAFFAAGRSRLRGVGVDVFQAL